MPTKKRTQNRVVKKTKTTSRTKNSFYQRAIESTKKKKDQYLARRPHRSFRKTERRDVFRSLKLPGYWAFTLIVWQTLWRNKRLFVWVAVVYSALTAAFVGMASQETYTALSETLRTSGKQVFEGDWNEIGQASLLLLSGLTGSFNVATNEAQQAYAAFFGMMAWLTTIWLLRSLLAGRQPRFRDGLYNAGGPIIPSLLLGFFLVIQLIPAALAILLANSAISSGFFEGAVGMIFAVAAILLLILSMYWTVSTLMALVIITLPGMYPLQAIRTAGDLVIGRRLRILYRWLWMLGVILVTWMVVVIPIIIFDSWLKGILPAIEWLPIVPLALLIMSSLSLVASATYVYLLYRKVVDDDAKPA